MFANNFKRLRKERKLTQAQIAQIIGVSTGCIASYEQGAHEPSLTTLSMIAQALNVSTDSLLGIDTSVAPQPESKTVKECLVLSSCQLKLLDKYLQMSSDERADFITELEKLSGDK